MNRGAPRWVVHAFLFLERKDHGLAVYVLCVYSYIDNENDFPTRVGTPGGKPLRLIARARKWRVRVSIVFGSGGLRVRYNNTIPSRQTLESDPLDDWTQPVARPRGALARPRGSAPIFCGSHKDKYCADTVRTMYSSTVTT